MSHTLHKLHAFLTQTFLIPSPPLAAEDLPSQQNKVIIITGANSGVGYELTKILYAADATIYLTARSSSKCLAAISFIRSEFPDSKGRLEFLQCDLSDLDSVRTAAREFLKREERLDVLVNNAGILGDGMEGQKTKQGYDITMGTNCLGPFLFTKLLTPLLLKTASEGKGTGEGGEGGTGGEDEEGKKGGMNEVRVLWAGSLGISLRSPPNGMRFSSEGNLEISTPVMYAESKVGSYFLAKEFARRYPFSSPTTTTTSSNGIISLSFNPGNLQSSLFQVGPNSQRSWGYNILWPLLFYPPIYGAYTELFAGFSNEITPENNGGYIIPWGRFAEPRRDIVEGTKSVEEGGTGMATMFWEWCDRETRGWC